MGAKPFEDFKKIIDEELKKTELERRQPRGALKLIAKGKTFNPLDSTVQKLTNPQTPSKGDPKANIVITEFTDYQ